MCHFLRILLRIWCAEIIFGKKKWQQHSACKSCCTYDLFMWYTHHSIW